MTILNCNYAHIPLKRNTLNVLMQVLQCGFVNIPFKRLNKRRRNLHVAKIIKNMYQKWFAAIRTRIKLWGEILMKHKGTYGKHFSKIQFFFQKWLISKIFLMYTFKE